MRLSGRNLAVAALLAVLVGIVFAELRGGGGMSRTELLPDANDPAVGDTSRGVDTAAVTPTRAPTAPTLVMIQGLTAQRLVIWPLDGSMPPLEVDRQVSMWPLLPSPDGQQVLYGTQHTVMVLDVAELRAFIVGTLPGGSRLIYAQWSPDGQAITYVVQTPFYLAAYYTLADGSAEAQLMLEVPSGLDLDVAWLPDGDPVAITLGVGSRGGLVTVKYRYSPVDGTLTTLPPDAATIQPWVPLHSPDGSQQVYSVTTWDEARYTGECSTGPLAVVGGGDWLPLMLRLAIYEPAIAFEIDGLYMDRPTWLADGRIVFRTVADPICTTLNSGFYIGELGREPVKLVESEPQYVSDDAEKLLWTASYALSPDETQIAWNESDLDAQRSRIYVKPIDSDVEDGANVRVLFETDAPQAGVPFTFQDEMMILYFVWLP